jgi:hypothetical protein
MHRVRRSSMPSRKMPTDVAEKLRSHQALEKEKEGGK